MTAAFVYMTAGSKDEAVTIGRALVEDRLAACVNVLENMTSLYWWDDAVQQEGETVLIAKTRSELLERLIERVKSLHSYSCPCIISWPIAAGHEAYLKWIEDESQQRD